MSRRATWRSRQGALVDHYRHRTPDARISICYGLGVVADPLLMLQQMGLRDAERISIAVLTRSPNQVLSRNPGMWSKHRHHDGRNDGNQAEQQDQPGM